MKAVRSSRRMGGVTLIELLISLVIGMVVVAAVLISFVDSGKVSRFQTAVGQMNQDAQVALNLLTREVQMAGYISPGQTLGAPALFGCDGTAGAVPFTSPKAAGTMTCGAATGTTVSALEVVYEADDKTTVPQGVAKTPSDCLGTGITVSGTIYITRNRYYVAPSSSGRKELHCASPAGVGGGAQPLIENVDDMQVWYGVTATDDPAAPGYSQVIRYAKAGKDATTADTVNAQPAGEWNKVMSVRICLLMRSAEPILTGEDTLTYLDCNSTSQTSADKYLRRAYFTTATVRTKMTS